MRPVGLIADDLTGALDAGAGFARAGVKAVLPLSGQPPEDSDAGVVLVNTESRELDEAAAARAAGAAAQRLQVAGVRRVYKKMDSVLRGHPGAELAAVLDVYGGRALVAPAFPPQGRTTVNGVQLLHGKPVTPYGGRLAAALGPAAGRCDLWDASTMPDLARIAAEAAQRPEYRVWCGTAGLAAHVPTAWQLQATASGTPAPPIIDRVLVVIGTRHPATLAQQTALLAAGWPWIWLNPRRDGDAAWEADLARRIVQGLWEPGARLLLSVNPGPQGNDAEMQPIACPVGRERVSAQLRRTGELLPAREGIGLIICGGETALELCRGLGVRSIEVLGEALPGVPTSLLHLGGGRQPVPAATKSGGFGGPEALVTVAGVLQTVPPRR
jgi:uncharacterized protein YgbK (DUF1537 family)